MTEKFKTYARLMRLHKPIGIFLLLWPTLWALWIANQGTPPLKLLIIFILGTIVMRSAGCVINDFADRDIDRYVARTQQRPLTSGQISNFNAGILFVLLLIVALMLVLFLNQFTVLLSVLGLCFAVLYPFTKRYTHWPQLFLGLAFAWGVPLAFAAVLNRIPAEAWLIYSAALIWAIIYDTMYAMVDRQDDLKIGVKSTAILFGRHDRLVIFLFQMIFFSLLICLGFITRASSIYYFSLVVAAFLAGYQQFLLKSREPEKCFQAFLNNNWLGAAIFLGIWLSF